MLTEYKVIIAKISALFIAALQVLIINNFGGAQNISPYLIIAFFLFDQVFAFMIFKDDCLTPKYDEMVKKEKPQRIYRVSKLLRGYFRVASIAESVLAPLFLFLCVIDLLKA